MPALLWKPPPDQTPSEWADDNRTLPSDSSEPGKWQTSRTPYVNPLCDAVHSKQYKRVFAMMMAQGGKSQFMFNAIGHKLDYDPEPVLYVGPTKTNIVKVVEPKVDQMIRGCESLSAKTVWGQKYTTTKKLVGGTSLRFAWAGSTTEIKADSASLVCVDEIDEIAIERSGQGSIIPLADARHKSYPDGMTIGASTPTLGNIDAAEHPDTGIEHWQVSDRVFSPIWILWQQGTRHEWAWPCPECDVFFVPRFKHLWWPEKSQPMEAVKTAKLCCPSCDHKVTNDKKEWMNSRGIAISPGESINKKGLVKGQGIASTDYTLWVSGLCNPFMTWGEIAANFLRAVRSSDEEAVRGVVNADLGECFATGGEAPTEDEVRVHAMAYKAEEVPEGVRYVFAGVDVQKDRLVYVVRGFGYKYESWLIDFGELWGDTQGREVWQDLTDLLETQYGDHRITRMMVDSGYRRDEVYTFCAANKVHARPAKGRETLDRPFYSVNVDVNAKGKVKKSGLLLWHFCTDTMKSWVHGRVSLDKESPGQWWLPMDITDDYCKQITAEERVAKPSGGVKWIQVGKDNHYLDCEALCYLAARMSDMKLKKPDVVTVEEPDLTVEQEIIKSRKASRTRRKKPSWRHL